MAFEINRGEERVVRLMGGDLDFADAIGRRYTGYFDGRHVVFHDGENSFAGRWLQGSSATSVQGGGDLPAELAFAFMDHGPAPQRLHALWEFGGSPDEAIEKWCRAGFRVSVVDRYLNRNHPRFSNHLRTRGRSITGADSSHVVIFPDARGDRVAGEIHVGEFNPLTGLGIGFVLHQLEGRLGGRRCSS
jgi:hypothetical protein